MKTPPMNYSTAWCPLEDDSAKIVSLMRLEVASYMEMMLKSPPVYFRERYLLEGWALTEGFTFEQPTPDVCHVKGWKGNGTEEARFSQLWVRAGYWGYRDRFLEFHRGLCDSFPDDLKYIHADHVINRARILEHAWVQIFPVPAAANRKYGSAFERYFPKIGRSTKRIDLPPLVCFKLFCGRVPSEPSELDWAMQDVRGQFLQSIPEIRLYCDRIERSVQCHMNGDPTGVRHNNVATLGRPRSAVTTDVAAILNPLLESGTPLHLAAQKGNAALAAVLLYQGQDPNACLTNGDTSLHLAAYFGHEEVSAYLIAAGANPNAARDRAATPLHFASHQGHASTVTALIAGGADVNRVRERGDTALHLAVQQGHAKVAAALLKAGADPNICRHDRCAPLHIAAQRDDAEVFSLLLSHGADPHATLVGGRTPLDLVSPHLVTAFVLRIHTRPS